MKYYEFNSKFSHSTEDHGSKNFSGSKKVQENCGLCKIPIYGKNLRDK